MSIKIILADPRTDSMWNEGDDGWWVSLAPGFRCEATDTHYLHAETVREVFIQWKTVKPCKCADCMMTIES